MRYAYLTFFGNIKRHHTVVHVIERIKASMRLKSAIAYMLLLYDDFPKAEQHRFIHQHRDGRYYVWAVYKKYVGLGTYHVPTYTGLRIAYIYCALHYLNYLRHFFVVDFQICLTRLNLKPKSSRKR